jgi:DNA-binding NtrC family response regulator
MSTLLYVDDEMMIGKAVARWFTQRGHTVRLADSIATAQRSITAHEPDALFIDVWLGDQSGFELMSWIEDSRPELADRVTFVTGELADVLRIEKVWHSLGRPVLQKPFEFADLERYIPHADERHGP